MIILISMNIMLNSRNIIDNIVFEMFITIFHHIFHHIIKSIFFFIIILFYNRSPITLDPLNVLMFSVIFDIFSPITTRKNARPRRMSAEMSFFIPPQNKLTSFQINYILIFYVRNTEQTLPRAGVTTNKRAVFPRPLANNILFF